MAQRTGFLRAPCATGCLTLSIKCVLQDDSVRYMIDCCGGAMQDPLFAYRDHDHDHANNIHKNLISEPANAKMRFHWPAPELVNRRFQIHAAHRISKDLQDRRGSWVPPLSVLLSVLSAESGINREVAPSPYQGRRGWGRRQVWLNGRIVGRE